ncbi:hypothetical protein llap_1066 [Limosa lapponica baueri]|uniref:Uncharacterized protein n=1 Tax=Limosa lapponica baueri TaxID=1758121 RepID=A0A2I0URE1_LIMLA|nr:hypothetical protein llap_1066 [Limosa lapponica baueri]
MPQAGQQGEERPLEALLSAGPLNSLTVTEVSTKANLSRKAEDGHHAILTDGSDSQKTMYMHPVWEKISKSQSKGQSEKGKLKKRREEKRREEKRREEKRREEKRREEKRREKK